ncbi:MAG: anti-sigma factor [Segetibacter sp.]|nr:anti-sigma factor [Segetibacter sp.]
MDIQAYIQSGIVESYVLGLTSAEERTEVERLRFQHIEVEEAINEFSLAVEKTAFENAIIPPADLKAKIMATIKEEEGLDESIIPLARQFEEGLVVPISSMRSWRMVAAAAVILLIVSAALSYYLYRQYSTGKEAYQALLSERQTLQANNEVYQTQLKEWQSAAAMMADTAMAMVTMHSPKGKDDAATVFWNTQNKDVYVMVNKLPEPKHGKQYQLWAMVDGKPVDAGVLNPSCSSVCKMKNIPKAEAFAITLEKEGGSPTPNLKSLFVMGNI